MSTRGMSRPKDMPEYKVKTPDDIIAQFGVHETERELLDVLNLIVAEFESDPMSVQCFDLRIVERAKAITLRYNMALARKKRGY